MLRLLAAWLIIFGLALLGTMPPGQQRDSTSADTLSSEITELRIRVDVVAKDIKDIRATLDELRRK